MPQGLNLCTLKPPIVLEGYSVSKQLPIGSKSEPHKSYAFCLFSHSIIAGDMGPEKSEL